MSHRPVPRSPNQSHHEAIHTRYDSDGNLLNNPSSSNTQVNWFDADGHATTFNNTTVVYDALGRAVEFTSGGTTHEYLYGPGGAKLAVMSGQSLEYALIPLPGGGDAEYYQTSGLIAYHHADWLGSERLASTPSGGLYDASAYGPFGESYAQTGSDPRFTGQIAGIATGSYDFLMREYSPTQSRWWTPDPGGLAAVNPNDPQSWNAYAYVAGTPLDEVDPNGLCPTGTHDATSAEMAAAIQVAETYRGEAHSSGAHFGTNSIDCSGLMMCALAGTPAGTPPATSYLGLNLTTRNIDQWTDPGTGAVGDLIYFAKPGHVGIITGPNLFFGAQSKRGVGFATFGLSTSWWGNPVDTSAPIFRRACVANSQTAVAAAPSAAGDGGGTGGTPSSSGGPLGFLGLGGVTGNWGDFLGEWLSAIMPNGTVTVSITIIPSGTVTVGQCETIGGKKYCF